MTPYYNTDQEHFRVIYKSYFMIQIGTHTKIHNDAQKQIRNLVNYSITDFNSSLWQGMGGQKSER